MFSPILRAPFGKVLLRSDTLWNFMYGKTR
jgi:hypothetical protein